MNFTFFFQLCTMIRLGGLNDFCTLAEFFVYVDLWTIMDEFACWAFGLIDNDIKMGVNIDMVRS